MPVITRVSAKAYFETGDKPTEAEFIDLIDTYQDFDPTVHAIASAAQGGQTGLLVIESTAQVTSRSLGAGVVAFLGAATTAAARNALELGSLALVNGITLSQIANQPGGTVLVFNTTGSAVALGGTSGNILVSEGSSTPTFRTFASAMVTATTSVTGVTLVATTADALAGTVARPPMIRTMRNHQGVVKAWLNWISSTATILDSYNISAIAANGVGFSTIRFTVPFATSVYSMCGVARANADNEGQIISVRATIGQQTAAGVKIMSETRGGVESHSQATILFIGDL